MKQLQDKTAIVTGGSKGIGKSIAHQSALMGANVIISSRKIEACEDTAKEINDDIGKEVAFPIACNIADDDQLKNLVDKTIQTLGGIDSLICNAATNTFMGSMLDMDIEQFDKVMHNNIRSNQLLCNLCLPHMIEKKDGSIIIISSIAAIKGSAFPVSYTHLRAHET